MESGTRAFVLECTSLAFAEPDRLAWPPSWVEHIPFAFWLIEHTAPATLVELGTHTGNSYAAFCQAVSTLSRETRCFAVDTWRGDAHAGFYDDTVYDELSRYNDQRYGRFSRLLRETFDQALGHFAPGSVDLLHIDGLHSYDAVRHDFESWRPRLSRSALVLFHDIAVRDPGFGVHRLWDELTREYPSFAFAHGYGLGVLGVGEDQPEAVRQLFAAAADPEQAQGVRAAFSALGRSLARRAQLELLERQGVNRMNSSRWLARVLARKLASTPQDLWRKLQRKL